MIGADKPYAGGRWSSAKFFGFIRSALRSASIRWPPKSDAMNAARRPYAGPNARQKWEYWCTECETWCMGKDAQADHIVPCGSLRCFADLPGFVERLFCESDGFRVVCKACHKAITAAERARLKNESEVTK